MTAMVLALWLAPPGMEITPDSTRPTPAQGHEPLEALAPLPDGDITAGPATIRSSRRRRSRRHRACLERHAVGNPTYLHRPRRDSSPRSAHGGAPVGSGCA